MKKPKKIGKQPKDNPQIFKPNCLNHAIVQMNVLNANIMDLKSQSSRNMDAINECKIYAPIKQK